jgi:16S rRNA (uracil1498-N3)-methyltransferase
LARFYVPPTAVDGKSFTLSGSEAHHALHVLRKKIGDMIELFDGKDACYAGRIDSIADDQIHGTLMGEAPKRAVPIDVVLYQGLSRSARWEWLLEKACEIGVSRVVPIASRRSVVKLTAAEGREKQKRWSRIALAASKQSGRSDLMEVDIPVSFADALPQLSKSVLALIPWEKETERTIHQAAHGYTGKSVAVFIGPEGGWEGEEVDQARQAGVLPVRLGPTLLRTETAGIVAAALALREFGIY